MMKRMCLVICIAAFVVAGGIASAEDIDLRALQEEVKDLRAKMAAMNEQKPVVAKGVTSLRKNAVVTIGGEVSVNYAVRRGRIKSKLKHLEDGTEQDAKNGVANAGQYPNGLTLLDDYVTRYKFNGGDIHLPEAKLEFKIDINEHFDAYLKLDMHNVDDSSSSRRSGVAQNYWVRWKNICNTGFNLGIGRDSLRWGRHQPAYIRVTPWTKSAETSANILTQWTGLGVDGFSAANSGEGMFTQYGIVPVHSAWDVSRITQVHGTWANDTNTFKAEIAFLQAIDTLSGITARRTYTDAGGTVHDRSINFGFGSVTSRFTWTPTKGLKVIASLMNLRADHGDGYWSKYPSGRNYSTSKLLNDNGEVMKTSDNNTALNLAVDWTPSFAKKWNFFAGYTRSWNDGWIRDLDNNLLTATVAYDITDRLNLHVLGDYLHTKNKQAVTWNKAQGWAVGGGFYYEFPYGVTLALQIRHERIDFKNRAGAKHTKAEATSVHTRVHLLF